MSFETQLVEWDVGQEKGEPHWGETKEEKREGSLLREL